MPSWQARVSNALVRTIVRRRDWGNLAVLARRARIVFGAPWPYQSLARVGLQVERVKNDTVRGEWIAPAAKASGIVLYIHGGGFASCSASTHRPITCGLTRRTGLAVFAANYRLAPEYRFPAALDDVAAAYEWLVREHPGVPIAISGDSAGGGLALSLAVRVRDTRLQKPSSVVLFSPWTDLAGRGASLHDNDGRDPMFRPENIPAFARVYLGEVSADDPRASPVYADLSELPPVLLQVGSTELLLDDSRRVYDRIVATGGTARLTVYDRVHHGWQMLAPLVPESRAALGEAAEWLLAKGDRRIDARGATGRDVGSNRHHDA